MANRRGNQAKQQRPNSNSKEAATKNPSSMWKLQHLQNLANWASKDENMPSLAAFFGRRLAGFGESIGVNGDPTVVSCQRCETILHPGYNCTIRIEKNRAKTRHQHKKPAMATQNGVVYSCHFCSHRNIKRGSPKGYMKEICPAKPKDQPRQRPVKSVTETKSKIETNSTAPSSLTTAAEEHLKDKCPVTPLKTLTLLEEAKRRKRNRSSSKKQVERESSSTITDAQNSVAASCKKRRKSWTSLKEIAETSVSSRNITNVRIPFSM